MSVHVSSRSQSKLEVNIKAHALCVYTLEITANKNVFSEKYQEALTNRIIDSAISVHTLSWQANNIRVESPELYRARLALQEQAALQCNKLLALIELAHKVFHLKMKRVIYWSDQVVEVRKLIRAWQSSDKSRYNDRYGV